VVLPGFTDFPINRIVELTPSNWAVELTIIIGWTCMLVEKNTKRPIELNGCSSIGKCPAFSMTASVLLGIPSLSARDSAGDVMMSFSPTITSVGTVMRHNNSLVSDLLSDAIAARATKSGVWITSSLAHSTRSGGARLSQRNVRLHSDWLSQYQDHQ
jgi:hypothetical protein